MTQEAQTKLLHGELSYQINGLLFDVHNELGQFAKEKQYGDLLEKKLISVIDGSWLSGNREIFVIFWWRARYYWN